MLVTWRTAKLAIPEHCGDPLRRYLAQPCQAWLGPLPAQHQPPVTIEGSLLDRHPYLTLPIAVGIVQIVGMCAG
jgi:hypothetical protein